MKTVHIDESGYTGYDLLNKDQPFQGASSLIIDEKTAEGLINELFPRRQAKELKHKNLSKSKANWDSLLKIQKIILKDFSGISYVCDKKYLLILRFLDDCVEPLSYTNGVNFYKDGHNYALASLLYYTANTLWGEEKFQNLLFYYQRASKKKTKLNVNILVDHAKSIIGRELSEFIAPLAANNDLCTKDILKQDNDTDIVFIVILSLISKLEGMLNEDYVIIHDNSKKLTKYKNALERIMAISETKKFKLTKETNLNFPLKLACIKQKDSKESYALQLADILIGGVIEHCKALKGLVQENDYNQKLITYYNNNNLLTMLPNIDLNDNKEFREGNQGFDLIGYLAEKIS